MKSVFTAVKKKLERQVNIEEQTKDSVVFSDEDPKIKLANYNFDLKKDSFLCKNSTQ